MPNRRPEISTPELRQALYHLSTSQLGILFSDLMAHYAEDHGINQADIDETKAARLKAKPERLIAERMRLERLRGIKQTEIDEIDESLTMIGKTAQSLGKTEHKGE